jgi:hypothetical protein
MIPCDDHSFLLDWGMFTLSKNGGALPRDHHVVSDRFQLAKGELRSKIVNVCLKRPFGACALKSLLGQDLSSQNITIEQEKQTEICTLNTAASKHPASLSSQNHLISLTN